jgi:hypothetical protein
LDLWRPGTGSAVVYEPTRFEVLSVGDEEEGRVVVEGRNLERLYLLAIQVRLLEWARAVDQDFGVSDLPRGLPSDS